LVDPFHPCEEGSDEIHSREVGRGDGAVVGAKDGVNGSEEEDVEDLRQSRVEDILTEVGSIVHRNLSVKRSFIWKSNHHLVNEWSTKGET